MVLDELKGDHPSPKASSPYLQKLSPSECVQQSGHSRKALDKYHQDTHSGE
jgi:hypothetical protein